MTTLVPLVLILGPGACDDRQVKIDELPEFCSGPCAEVPVQADRKLDVLFVLDNSGSMEEELDALRAGFQGFVDGLDSGPLGRLDLHVGAITTDVGTGEDNEGTGCSAYGNRGQLHNRVDGPDCQPADSYFIIDINAGDGTRIRNYPGTIGGAFNCIANVGTNGCGFEQPLASVQRALEDVQPFNVGFRRDNADLLIVILSDEDDCSVFDNGLFDTTQNGPTEPLGYLHSFRCFDFGVRCDPDNPREPGQKSDCEPRADSPYTADINSYVDFLDSLEDHKGQVMVAAIVGDPGPIEVIESDFGEGIVGPALAPSCLSVRGGAAPAVRLAAFVEAFGDRGTFARICEEDLSGPLATVASRAAERMTIQCLTIEVADSDGDPQNGVQPECMVFAGDPNWLPHEQWAECDHPTEPENTPCFVLEPHEACTETPTGLNLRIVPPDPRGNFPDVYMRCVE